MLRHRLRRLRGLPRLTPHKVWIITYQKPGPGWLCAVDNEGMSMNMDCGFYTNEERANFKLKEFQKKWPDRTHLRVVPALLITGE